MSEYISREEFEKRIKPYDTSDRIDKALYNFAHNTLICCSSADVRPNIHGEWIYQEGVTPYKWRCNKCEKMFKTDFNYCPNCGADMREPKDILHKAIDNTTFAEEAYPNIKEELHKAVDMAEPKGEKGTE